ncbi:MAG: fasciclin domain-containing protein [Rhodospirillaceae bacterium]|nr:fasciclin domain-containing protein [Rhodospirillaceae bacterium]
MYRKFFVLVLAALLVLPGTGRAKDILETATDAGTFTILLAAVKAAGLAPLMQGKGPMTLFAPTDDAFAKLPKATMESLLRPENKEKLRQLITFHLVMGRITSHDFMGKRLEAATVEGGFLLIDATKGIMIDDAKMIKADLIADNGFIHVIDTVLMPH